MQTTLNGTIDLFTLDFGDSTCTFLNHSIPCLAMNTAE